MRGHVQQRGSGTWRIKVVRRPGRRPAASGTSSTTIKGTRREAERELSRLVVEIDEGRHAAAAPMTVDELLDRWLAVKEPNVEASTIRSYTWLATTYLRPALGHRKLAALRPMELDQLYSNLHSRGLSPRTVRMCHTVMRQSLEQARRWGLIARSPAVDATPPRQKRHQVTPPTVAEVHALLRAAGGLRPRLPDLPVGARRDRLPEGPNPQPAVTSQSPAHGFRRLCCERAPTP